MVGAFESFGLCDLWSQNAVVASIENDPDFAWRCAERIDRELAGIHFNPSKALVPLRPVILHDEQRATIANATLTLTRLIHRVCWGLTNSPAELARKVGLTKSQVKLIGAGGDAHEIEHGMCNGRFDFVPSDGTPMFLEANFGIANIDPTVVQRLFVAYEALHGIKPRSGPDIYDRPFEARAQLYRRICEQHGLPKSVIVLGQADESTAGDERYYEAEPEYLRSIGFESAFLTPDAFADSAENNSYSVVVKHFLSEYWECSDARLVAMRASHANSIFLVPDASKCLSSKVVFAWLSAEEVPLSDSERHFVKTHIPWTRRTGSGEVIYEEQSWRLPELAIKRREDFVLKPISSCGGQGVVIGWDTEPDAWECRIAKAVAARDHILQRFIASDPLSMDFFDRTISAARQLPVRYVLGAYVVDNVSAGFTIRHSTELQSAVINVDQGASMNIVI